MSGDAWLRQGNCADAEPDVMYPEPREPIEEALAMCASCPVRTPCLVRALEARDRHGVWGGHRAPRAPRDDRSLEGHQPLGSRRLAEPAESKAATAVPQRRSRLFAVPGDFFRGNSSLPGPATVSCPPARGRYWELTRRSPDAIRTLPGPFTITTPRTESFRFHPLSTDFG
ncbi:WhiB family transcriptional regulator [Glycomyces algeriensis]